MQFIGGNVNNIILQTDSYKHSHYLQFPADTEGLFYYIEARSDHQIKFFGLQYYLKRYLSKQVTIEDINQAEKIIEAHGLPFNRSGWEYIVNQCNGKLPIKIKAVAEGTVVKGRNVIMTIECTDNKVAWLVGFLETILLKVWYPTSIATKSMELKTIIQEYMQVSCDTLDKLPFMVHDFGYRGVSSEESAMIGGLAHLTNFMGTDTIASLICASEYYNEQMAGYSIPASEHSTITSYGSDGEEEAFINMIDKFGNRPLYACVSDSYDFNKAVEKWNQLASKVKAAGGTLVVRPDSGDPLSNIKYALQTLEQGYGYTVNAKGYKVLNNVAIIQGDKVNKELIINVLEMMHELKYSADNIAFGMGGALLQGNFESSVNRDTYGFACKCSSIKRNGKWNDVFKNPKGEISKQSKRGRLDLIMIDGEYKTVLEADGNDSQLITYFENGKLKYEQSLQQIRNR